MKRQRIAIIADDLSGALDAGSPFAARGMRVLVTTTPAATAALPATSHLNQADVVAVNTESRHLGIQAAASAVRTAAQYLQLWRPDHWYKKIDSTLRGQIVAESMALREILGKPLMICPASPKQQRIVRNGKVWVEGKPIDQTVYADDALSAAGTGAMADQFASAGLPVTQCDIGTIHTRHSDFIADAQTEVHLRQLQASTLRGSEQHPWINVGAGGLAEGLAEHLLGPVSVDRPELSASRRIYVVGSRNPRALQQIEALRDLWASAGKKNGGYQLLTSEPWSGSTTSAACVAKALAEQAVAHMSDWQSEQGFFVLCGGDIAIAVLRELEVSMLWLEGELLPGLPLAKAYENPQCRVITKPGGFGEPGLFTQLESLLAASS